MNDAKAPKKRGRPPKFAGSEERVARSLRMSPEIEARLREAAEANHRSMAEELEFRVTRSFETIPVSLGAGTFSALESRSEHNNRTVNQEISAIIESFLASDQSSGLYSSADRQNIWSGLFDSVLANRSTEEIIAFLKRAPDKGWEEDNLPSHIDNVNLKMLTAVKIMGLLLEIMNMPPEKAARIKFMPVDISVDSIPNTDIDMHDRD